MKTMFYWTELKQKADFKNSSNNILFTLKLLCVPYLFPFCTNIMYILSITKRTKLE